MESSEPGFLEDALPPGEAAVQGKALRFALKCARLASVIPVADAAMGVELGCVLGFQFGDACGAFFLRRADALFGRRWGAVPAWGLGCGIASGGHSQTQSQGTNQPFHARKIARRRHAATTSSMRDAGASHEPAPQTMAVPSGTSPGSSRSPGNAAARIPARNAAPPSPASTRHVSPPASHRRTSVHRPSTSTSPGSTGPCHLSTSLAHGYPSAAPTSTSFSATLGAPSARGLTSG